MAQPPPRLDSVLSSSFGTDEHRPTNDEADTVAYSDDDDDAGFEFAFAPPLAAAGHDAEGVLAPADDLFAHGRIVPAYPVFHRHRDGDLTTAAQPQASTAPPSPDTFCAWAPRSAPGSPARDGPFPKSASTGEARRFWLLRDLVAGAGGRSHSDGKEKFVFVQPTAAAAVAAPPSKMSANKAAVEEGRPRNLLRRSSRSRVRRRARPARRPRWTWPPRTGSSTASRAPARSPAPAATGGTTRTCPTARASSDSSPPRTRSAGRTTPTSCRR